MEQTSSGTPAALARAYAPLEGVDVANDSASWR